MTVIDQKRMAKACRTYGALLRYYPVSFQQKYGEILSLHFRDEYRSALASGGHFPLLGFWVFILFDFLRSLLMEVQEEVVIMVKKNFFVFCAIAAGLVTLLQLPISSPYVFTNDKVDMWGQLLFLPLFLGCTSLTLFGIAKATRSHLLFQILPLLMLGASFIFLPVPRKHSYLGTWEFLGSYLGFEEANMVRIAMASYHILIALTGILLMLVKRKWLPGVILVMMGSLPTGITALATIIPSFGESDDEWFIFLYIYLYIFLFTAAWFVIAWWLKKEREEISQPGRLEAA